MTVIDERLLMSAAELVAAIGDQAARDNESWNAGYRYAARMFFNLGIEVGRQQLGNEILAEEARFSAHMSTITRMRSHAELEALRYPGYTHDELRKLREWCAE